MAIKSFRQSTIAYPELFFGIVSAVGTDVPSVIEAFASSLRQKGYLTHHVKVSALFPPLAKSIRSVQLQSDGRIDKINSYIEFGNHLRKELGNDILAALSVGEITRLRNAGKRKHKGIAYIIDQIKTTEELDLVREIYGTNFFQVSVYSARDVRVDNLARLAAHDRKRGDRNSFRNEAEQLAIRDEDEKIDHGQKVGKIFQLADIVIDADKIDSSNNIVIQVDRFIDLLFGSNKYSPNRLEYGMYLAYSAALRSLDLSRQVGAAIFRSTGEVASLGSNEVPKANGGTYWADDKVDAREYKLKKDSNDERKEELLNEVLEIALGKPYSLSEEVKSKLADAQFMDALEYGRIVHAEMCAITDAARLGISLAGGTLYCTTFPCHMCAKHIVASGISTVVFLEPYPKSLTADLHSDAVRIQGTSRGAYEGYPAVLFQPFCGITPRRYREIFSRTKRKVGRDFSEYFGGEPKPVISTLVPAYLMREVDLFKLAVDRVQKLVEAESAKLG